MSGDDRGELDGFTFGARPTDIHICLVAKSVYERHDDEEVTDERCKCCLMIAMSVGRMGSMFKPLP